MVAVAMDGGGERRRAASVTEDRMGPVGMTCTITREEGEGGGERGMWGRHVTKVLPRGSCVIPEV